MGDMTLSYRWFRIVDVRSLAREGLPENVVRETGGEWYDWSINFIAEIEIEADQLYRVRVDALPLLHELLSASAKLGTSDEFGAEIGEGLRLYAKAELGILLVRIVFAAGRRNDTLVEHSLSLSNGAMFFALKAAELAQSLALLNVDIEKCLTRFPANAFESREK